MRAIPTDEQRWLNAMIAGGVRVYDADGVLHDGTNATMREAAQAVVDATRNDGLPAIIPIRPTHGDHEIRITDTTGHEERLDVVLRWGNDDEAAWYSAQIERLQMALDVCEDIADMKELTAKIREYKRDRIRLSVPDMPRDLLTRLEPQQVGVLLTAIRRIELDGMQVVVDAQKKMLEPYAEKRDA